MDSMINQMNDNLRVIINNMKGDIDTLNSTLENIQYQMDKKVEEAKKYKIEVDTCKDIINKLEQDNDSLNISLKELNDKYSKLNLVSIIEAGNREIKSKVNDNIKEINKNKEHIAELTNRARTIKDLLVNLKKDKSSKQDRVKNLNEIYSYYSNRINEIIDYANDHANNLSDYKISDSHIIYNDSYDEVKEDNTDLENTMVFDEIASIDHNKNFKDEMSFINDQINDNISNETEPKNINRIIENSLNNLSTDEDDTDQDESNDSGLSKKLDDNNSNDFINENNDESVNDNITIDDNEKEIADLKQFNEIKEDTVENNETNDDLQQFNEIEEESIKNDELEKDDLNPFKDESELSDNSLQKNTDLNLNNSIPSTPNLNLNIPSIELNQTPTNLSGEESIDLDESRVNKLNDLFSEIDNKEEVTNDNNTDKINNTLNSIDKAYEDSFGKSVDEPVKTTLTDIFGNPIKENDVNEVSTNLSVEDLFKDNNLDFNNFKDDEKDYLKQIYDENKFKSIFEVLKNNKINLDNIYNAFNVFGEISASELESLISKLLNIGQSAITIGYILEKLPKVKKYDLDSVIASYGDYIKNIDITELIMKAKKNYDNGGNN